MAATPPTRAVLFDFDGTLADSYAAITASVNHVRASFGFEALEETEVRRYVGRGPDLLMWTPCPGLIFNPPSIAIEPIILR